jgi:hypothetical protein
VIRRAHDGQIAVVPAPLEPGADLRAECHDLFPPLTARS